MSARRPTTVRHADELPLDLSDASFEADVLDVAEAENDNIKPRFLKGVRLTLTAIAQLCSGPSVSIIYVVRPVQTEHGMVQRCLVYRRRLRTGGYVYSLLTPEQESDYVSNEAW